MKRTGAPAYIPKDGAVSLPAAIRCKQNPRSQRERSICAGTISQSQRLVRVARCRRSYKLKTLASSKYDGRICYAVPIRSEGRSPPRTWRDIRDDSRDGGIAEVIIQLEKDARGDGLAEARESEKCVGEESRKTGECGHLGIG